MFFKIEDEIVYLKYTETWNKIKKSLNTRFPSQPIYDGKYIKTKVKTFSDMINTAFSDNGIPKEKNHYICIAAICIDSVLKIDKKNILKSTWNNVNTKQKEESQYILSILK